MPEPDRPQPKFEVFATKHFVDLEPLDADGNVIDDDGEPGQAVDPTHVLNAALAAGGGGATLSGLVWAGLEMAQAYNVPINDTQQATTTAFVALAMLVVGPPLGALWARARVTPTVDPRAGDGTPLVPIPVPDDEPAPAGRHYRPVSDTGHPLT